MSPYEKYARVIDRVEPVLRAIRALCLVAVAAILFGMILILAFPAHAQTVTDGDTLKMNGTTYRLHGIDAPESKQTCGDWPAGTHATSTLQALISGRSVICEYRATDRYGRTVALCRANGEDVGAAMVSLGMAWAFTRYSRDYVDQEAFARKNFRGVHAHDCKLPWEYRSEKR